MATLPPANKASIQVRKDAPRMRRRPRARWYRGFGLLLQGLGIVPSTGAVGAEAIALALLAWLPFGLYSLGEKLVSQRWDAYFLDPTLHARFLLAVPLMHIGSVISVRLARLSLHRLADEGVGPQRTLGAFGAEIGTWMEDRRRALALLVISVVLGQALYWGAIGAPLGLKEETRGAMHRIWVQSVGFPIFYFVGARALLTWLVWCRILWRMTRVPLRLSAAHPDYSGGLEFMVLPSRAFCIVVAAFSCVLAADWGASIAFEGADVGSFGTLLGMWSAAALVVTMGPLLLLAPRLLRTRLRGLQTFGALATSYVRQFERRWIRPNPAKPLLGTSDLQSLADLGNSFRVVREMRIFLVGKREVLLVLLASAGPALPLLFTKFPVFDLLERLVLTMVR